MKSLVLMFIAIVVFTGCSKKSEEEYLKTAEDNLKKNKFQEAVSDFEGLVTEYPESEKAPDVLTKLASIYQNKLLKNIDEHTSLEKAASYYKKVFDEYPNSLQAPASLFLSGFIHANELKNYKQAEVTYNLFLQKFPSHELAASAREELNNLGLSPEEILKNKNEPNI